MIDYLELHRRICEQFGLSPEGKPLETPKNKAEEFICNVNALAARVAVTALVEYEKMKVEAQE